ncbi:hypothetical protein N0V82_007346 [Gnomoniopsis sp. IMI 355080]|nr:hypothetical protein N0V82_007346 [Gnomoniopsis sp. IMI 355080]
MSLEPDAKRLHKTDDLEPEAPPADVANEDTFSDKSEVQGKGDPRLLDWVHFEHCAPETFSEEFCVPSKSNAKPKSMKRAKNEGNIKRADLEYFCSTILTQTERRGYWEIDPDQCTEEPTIIFEFETVAFVVQCEERKVIR